MSNLEIPGYLIQEAKQQLGNKAIQIIDLPGYNDNSKKAPCPFHNEKTPSFSWDDSKNQFYCFGCSESLDIIRFYQEFRRMTFQESVQELFQETNTQFDFNMTEKEIRNQKIAIHERKATQQDLKADLIGFNDELLRTSSIYNYIIKDWGLKAETINKYRLGYSNNGYFKGRIIIPYLNKLKEPVYATGRDTTGKSDRKYLKLKSSKEVNGETIKMYPTTPLFNEYELPGYKDYVIAVEGEKDCLTLLQENFQTIAFSGSNIKELNQLKRYKSIKTIYVIPDKEKKQIGDNKAIEIGELLGIDKTVKIAELPLLKDRDKTDVNDFYNYNKNGFKASIESLLSKAIEYKHKAKPFNTTDTGNAERLVYHYGEDLRFRVDSKEWLKWNKVKWSNDELLEVEQITKEVARNISYEVQNETNKGAKERLQKWQLRSESKRVRADMLDLAKNEKGIPIKANMLDQNSFLLNCNNGTINLKNGEIKAHNKKDFITKSVNLDYKKDSKCPRWDQFLMEIMDNDSNMVDFLQRAIGHSITGDTTEQVMFIPYGIGSNGKSLFLDTLKEVVGCDYTAQVQAESLSVKRDGKEASPDIMRLEGKRFVTSSESEKGGTLNEALIKQATGDKAISGRRLYSETIEFSPQFKLWLATNHKPRIKGTDNGIWRRILLIPFTQRFYDAHEGKTPIKDKGLQEKLNQELEGILNWIVQGAIKWYQDGLKVPLVVRKATDEYRDGEDTLQDFINTSCIVNSQAKVLFKDLFDSYNNYCLWSNEKIIKKKEFKELLLEKELTVTSGTGNALTVYGIGLSDVNATNNGIITI